MSHKPCSMSNWDLLRSIIKKNRVLNDINNMSFGQQIWCMTLKELQLSKLEGFYFKAN